MNQTPSHYSGTPGSPGIPSAEPSGSVVDQAQGKVGQVVDQAQGTASQVAEEAKQQAASQLDSQKERAVGMLVTLSQALRQTGQHLHEQQQGNIGGYVEQAAERVESMTNFLRARDVPALLAETQGFARREPGLFLGGAVALGFLGARFLRSSGQRALAQHGARGGYEPAPGYVPASGYSPPSQSARAYPSPARAPDAGGMAGMPTPSGSAPSGSAAVEPLKPPKPDGPDRGGGGGAALEP